MRTYKIRDYKDDQVKILSEQELIDHHYAKTFLDILENGESVKLKYEIGQKVKDKFWRCGKPEIGIVEKISVIITASNQIIEGYDVRTKDDILHFVTEKRLNQYNK